jgi:hypothetical protein
MSRIGAGSAAEQPAEVGAVAKGSAHVVGSVPAPSVEGSRSGGSVLWTNAEVQQITNMIAALLDYNDLGHQVNPRP